MIDDTQRRVLELRRAGVPFERIAAEVQLEDVDQARSIFDQAIEQAAPSYDSKLEADRLDRLLAAVWPKAIGGDLTAVERAIKIGERREKLSARVPEDQRNMRDAYDASLTSSPHINDVDQALIESGRTIADRIDAAIALGEGQEVTKALFLLPHMVNILRELLATPAARLALDRPPNPDGGKLAQLRALQGGKTAKRARS
jgi:hypothetical protein